MMERMYEKPAVEDFGELVTLTQAAGIAAAEDGSGKTVQAGVEGVVGVSVTITP